jgi:hypothetical protein
MPRWSDPLLFEYGLHRFAKMTFQYSAYFSQAANEKENRGSIS